MHVALVAFISSLARREYGNAKLANISVKELHAELCRVCHAGSDVAWSALDQGTSSRIPWRGACVPLSFRSISVNTYARGLFVEIICKKD